MSAIMCVSAQVCESRFSTFRLDLQNAQNYFNERHNRYSLPGLSHGRRSRGTSPPRIWSRGTLVQIVPLRFLSYRYKKERSVAFKIRQNPFSAGALPRTPLGELTTLPQTP